MTPEERLFTRLANARTQAGGVLTKAAWLAVAKIEIAIIVREAVEKAIPAPRTKRQAGPRARNLLFDAMAMACGYPIDRIPRNMAKRIAVALTDVREVEPELTPERITGAAARYRAKHPTWELTPTALATHWAEIHGAAATKINSVIPEPQDWRVRWADITSPEHAYLDATSARFIESWATATRNQQLEIIGKIRQPVSA